MKFHIRGIKTIPNKVPRMVKRIIEFLDKAKFGDLYPLQEMAAKLGILEHASICRYTQNPLLIAYREREPNRNALLWGSKKTIAAYRKELRKHA